MDVFLVNILLFLLPLIYVIGFFSFNSLRYFFFGTIVLILTIFTTIRFIKNKWLINNFFKSWYSYGLIAYLTSFFIVSITSIDPALSFFSSFSRSDGFFAILFLSLFSLSIYSIISVSENKKEIIKQFLASSVLGAVVLSIFILFSSEGLSIFNWNWLTKTGGGAMTGNQSIAGSYIIWNIFFAVILFFKSDFLKEKIFSIFSFFILIFSPLFFNWHLFFGKIKYSGLTSFVGLARGVFLGIIFGFLVAIGIYFLLQKNKIKKYIGIGLISIIFISTILGGISLLQKSSVLHQKFIENVGGNRFIFWDAALEGFKESPLVGIGPSNFGYSFHKYFNAKLEYEVMVDKAHNIFFESLVNGGILLILALLFFITSIITGLIKLAKKNEFSILEISLFIGVLFGWLFQAQFVFDSILSLSMLFLICGILYGCLEEKIENHKKIYYFSKKEKLVIFIIVLVIISLFIYTIALPYKKNRTMYKTYSTSLPARIILWKDLSGISPMGDSIDTVVMFDKVFKSYYTEIKMKYVGNWDIRKKEIILKELDAIINYFSNSTYRKDDYEFITLNIKFGWIRMYIANDFSGFLFDKTKELIKKAMLLSPTDPQPYWLGVQIEIANQNFSEAKSLLEKAFSLEPKLKYTNNMILLLAKDMKDEVYYNFALKRAGENISNFIINNEIKFK